MMNYSMQFSRIFVAVLCSSIFLFVSCTRNPSKQPAQQEGFQEYFALVDANEFDAAIAAAKEKRPSPIFLDLRDSADYEAGHIPSFLNVTNMRDGEPLATWSAPLNREKEVFLICYSGKRSSQAHESLAAAGFLKITEFTPGYAEYSRQKGSDNLIESGSCDCPK